MYASQSLLCARSSFFYSFMDMRACIRCPRRERKSSSTAGRRQRRTRPSIASERKRRATSLGTQGTSVGPTRRQCVFTQVSTSSSTFWASLRRSRSKKFLIEDSQRFFDVNVLSGVGLARLVLPQMKRKNWGRIIFISSGSAVQIPSEMIRYGVRKSAQRAAAGCDGPWDSFHTGQPAEFRSGGTRAVPRAFAWWQSQASRRRGYARWRPAFID